MLFAVADKESYVFALTRESFDWKPHAAWRRSARRRKLPRFAAASMSARRRDASGKSGLFDLALANELYVTLLGPVETLVKDKRSLLVAPSGALTALPFHLLVTEKPPAAIPETFAGYRDAAWLLKRQAVSVLPSVASLKALRAFARNEQGIKPMTGFGDPLFNPTQDGSGDNALPARPNPHRAALVDVGLYRFLAGRRRRSRAAGASAAATAGYGRRTERGRERPRRCRLRHSSRRRRQRDHRQACAARRLRHRLFRHPRPRRRRRQGPCRTIAGAEHPEASRPNSTTAC